MENPRRSTHSGRGAFGRRLAAAALIALAAGPASASCRLALVLAIDTSYSVDSTEYAQQFDGIAQAFLDVEVREAIFASAEPVAVAAFEWGAPDFQVMVADWIVLNHGRDADRLASILYAHARARIGGPTAIGIALVYGRDLLARAPPCRRRVIDVSGDGYNNRGPEPREVYAVHDFGATVVNALVVSGRTRPKLLEYFAENVIRGSGAFAEATVDFEDYGEAIKRKLLRELKPFQTVASVGGGGR